MYSHNSRIFSIFIRGDRNIVETKIKRILNEPLLNDHRMSKYQCYGHYVYIYLCTLNMDATELTNFINKLEGELVLNSFMTSEPVEISEPRVI